MLYEGIYVEAEWSLESLVQLSEIHFGEECVEVALALADLGLALLYQ